MNQDPCIAQSPLTEIMTETLLQGFHAADCHIHGMFSLYSGLAAKDG